MSEPTPMPEVAPPVWENIPAALADRQQWLLWKFEWPEVKPGRAQPKKWAKVPYYVSGGRRTGDQGGERDMKRLATLPAVRKAFERGGWHGVGFGFVESDGMIAIDIDNALDQDTGEWSPRCLEIIKACDSVTEISPSGNGCHIFVLGHTESAKVNAFGDHIGLEMFCGSQYFTVTGRPWPNAPTELRAIEDRLLKRLNKTIADGKEAKRAAGGSKKAGPAQPSARGNGDYPPESPAELKARVQSALDGMLPDLDYEDWISIGWALADAFGDAGFAMWDAWSARGGTYPGEADLKSHWRSFKSSGKAADDVVAVIFARARDAGWKAPRRSGVAKSGKKADRAGVAPAATSDAAAGAGSGGPHDDGGGPQDGDEGQEMPDIPLKLGKGRKPEDCRENVLYCLRHDPTLKGLVSQNLFTELQDKTRTPPWGGEPGEWTEEDDLMLGEYLLRIHGLLIKGASTLRAGVQMAARECKHHPVTEGLRAIQWDGIPRLDHWLVDCLGAADRPYVRMISRFFIMGMVARLLRPGCKFDYMLILQGDQGLGKSTAFRVLAAPYFMDTPFRIGDKDSYLSLQGVWLVEFSELESMSKAESTAIKAFVSSVEDRFRPPYGSRMVKMPRRAVLAGTTNSDQFLKDSTGDRRMWPVHVTEVNVELLKSIRDQLFAEALHLLESKDAGDAARYYPTREEEKELFHPEQDRWRMVDVWADILGDYIARDDMPPDATASELPPSKRGFFTAQELFSKALQIKAERMDNAKLMQVRVSNAMRELGFAAVREPTGARKRGYLRPGWEFASGGILRRLPVKQAAPQGQEVEGAGAPTQRAGEVHDHLPI